MKQVSSILPGIRERSFLNLGGCDVRATASFDPQQSLTVRLTFQVLHLPVFATTEEQEKKCLGPLLRSVASTLGLMDHEDGKQRPMKVQMIPRDDEPRSLGIDVPVPGCPTSVLVDFRPTGEAR